MARKRRSQQTAAEGIEEVANLGTQIEIIWDLALLRELKPAVEQLHAVSERLRRIYGSSAVIPASEHHWTIYKMAGLIKDSADILERAGRAAGLNPMKAD